MIGGTIPEIVATALGRGYSAATIYGMVLEQHPRAEMRAILLSMELLAARMVIAAADLDELGRIEALAGPVIAAGAAASYDAAISFMAEHGDEEAALLVQGRAAEGLRSIVELDLVDRARRGEMTRRVGSDGRVVFGYPERRL
jgi:hypothetical protein